MLAHMQPTDTPLVAIVDDDDLIRRSIERLVRSAGFRVATFSSAEDFLERGDLDGTACAVLDVRLPGVNGFELHQQLLARPRAMPIVFVSAHADAVMQANTHRPGAVAFLRKPFDDDTLLDALHRAIE